MFAALDAQLNIGNGAVLRLDNATGMLELAAGQGALACRSAKIYCRMRCSTGIKMPRRVCRANGAANGSPALRSNRVGAWSAC
ncbi:MAG: hypothetical protein DCC52_05600 [Chloroflexi bacterium]|nr:MAG: hypothetical protein DCC52_05600 [Chloroflexota bacterium]